MLYFALRRLYRGTRARMRHAAFGLLPLSFGVPHAMAETSGAAATVSPAVQASAEPAATTLPAVTITASGTGSYRPAVDPNLPASIETVTREQFDNWNVVNTEDVSEVHAEPGGAQALYRRPELDHRRARHQQCRRARAVSSMRTGCCSVNLLGNSYSFPPRWSMVFPDEIQQVDVIYGPFSALYPGNSLGATVLISTRMPKQFEADADVKAFTQHFEPVRRESEFQRQRSKRVDRRSDRQVLVFGWA